MALLQHVLNFDCRVEGYAGKLLLHCAGNTHGMCRAIEEVRVTEGDMTGSLFYLRTDVGQDSLCRYSEEASMIDRRDRAVQAPVLAASRCFSVPCKHCLPVYLYPSIAKQRRQELAFWHRENRALYPGFTAGPACANSWNGSRIVLLQGGNQFKERNLVLAADNRIGGALQQVGSVEPGIMTIKADMRTWIK